MSGYLAAINIERKVWFHDCGLEEYCQKGINKFNQTIDLPPVIKCYQDGRFSVLIDIDGKAWIHTAVTKGIYGAKRRELDIPLLLDIDDIILFVDIGPTLWIIGLSGKIYECDLENNWGNVITLDISYTKQHKIKSINRSNGFICFTDHDCKLFFVYGKKSPVLIAENVIKSFFVQHNKSKTNFSSLVALDTEGVLWILNLKDSFDLKKICHKSYIVDVVCQSDKIYFIDLNCDLYVLYYNDNIGEKIAKVESMYKIASISAHPCVLYFVDDKGQTYYDKNPHRNTLDESVKILHNSNTISLSGSRGNRMTHPKCY